MFNTDDIQVRRGLLSGNFGLEKEMLRITKMGICLILLTPFLRTSHASRATSVKTRQR